MKFKERFALVLAYVLCCSLLPAAPARAATLVKDGKAAAVVALPPEPDDAEKLAAAELIDHLQKMSGAKLESVTVDPKGLDEFLEKSRADGKAVVCLGRLALPRVEKAIAAKSDWRGTFALHATVDHVFAAGIGEGTHFAISELLEQQGVRWFMPGDLGTVIPKLETVEVKEQETVQAPSFASRWFQMPDKDWQVRMRCGGKIFPSAHGLPGVPPFKEKPELYSLIKGERVRSQHCLSNPELLKYVVAAVKEFRGKGHGPAVGVGPNDGSGFCECENCRALDAGDYDPFSAEPSVTDRYIWFFNKVLEGVSDEYPDTKLAFYIYHSYMRPPVKVKPDKRIMGALAPITLDRVHGFSNPLSPEKSYARWLLQEWGKLLPEVTDRGYWSNLADPGFNFVIVHRLRDEIPASKDLGLYGWRVETFPNYGPQFPSMYVAARLMWDHAADVDAILADVYEKFFGPAAGPMGKYVAMMDAALRDTPHMTGCAWDMPYFYPIELRKQARSLLEEGAQLAAGKGEYEARVRMITECFDMTEAFIEMLEARVRNDFEGAQKALERCDAEAEKLMAYKPVSMVSFEPFSTYKLYMERFYRPATEQAYKRVTGGNKLVAAAADEWDFLIDPPKVGEDIGLWRDGAIGGNWQKIKTTSSSWGNQGLRYYKGLSWYRQTLKVPEEFEGKRVFLWCGGIDEKAKVWVNGKEIGVSHEASFMPFEMDVTQAVRAGDNTIALAVMNQTVDELGTGGIVAPLILWAPADPSAEPENPRPMAKTFP